MQPKRILVPVDISNCPLEVFDSVNTFASKPGVTIILLNVLNVSIVAPENRVYEEMAHEAQQRLQRLAQCIDRNATTLTHVRMGKPAEQILSEAKTERADLVILPISPPSFWDRLTSLWRPPKSPIVSPLAETIGREAPCSVYLVLTGTRQNSHTASLTKSHQPEFTTCHPADRTTALELSSEPSIFHDRVFAVFPSQI